MKATNQSEWLTLLRRRLGGISSEALGKLAGASRMSAWRWHNPGQGGRNGIPSLNQAVRLAALADTSLEEVASIFGLSGAREEARKARKRIEKTIR